MNRIFVSNGRLQPQPVLEIPVDSQSERGLLGIAVQENINNDNNSNQNGDTKNIVLYYTKADQDNNELRNDLLIPLRWSNIRKSNTYFGSPSTTRT